MNLVRHIITNTHLVKQRQAEYCNLTVLLRLNILYLKCIHSETRLVSDEIGAVHTMQNFSFMTTTTTKDF